MIKTNSETETRIIIMYKNGKSMQCIAKELSVSTGTVYLHLKNHVPEKERKTRQHQRSMNAKTEKEFKNLYIDGLSTVKIARKFNTTSEIVRYALKKQGVDTSKGGKYLSKVTDSDLGTMKELYSKTGSILETAKSMNLHPSSVHNRLKQLGLVRKKTINQNVAKHKYELLTQVLVALFNKMEFQITLIQYKYNGHGPDMIIKKGKEIVIIEHKATIKRSFYWKHAIEEAKINLKKHNASQAWVITTATKPKDFSNNADIRVIFYDELKQLLTKHELEELIQKVDFIANTPCV